MFDRGSESLVDPGEGWATVGVVEEVLESLWLVVCHGWL